MAFRGRGRGRGGFGGGFGGGFRSAKQVSFELYPEVEGLGSAEYSTTNLQLIKWYSNLQKYWHSSPYYYEDGSGRSKKVQKPDIERYSDRYVQRTKSKAPLSHFIRMDPDHVPAELVKGEKKERFGAKRVRWNPESDMHKLDVFEKLEQKMQGQEGKEKKENEDEEEEDEGNEEEEEEEYDTDDDYNQNQDFDDDEDDYNMPDDNNDEGEF